MKGPAVMLVVLVIAALLVAAHLAHEKNREARRFDGVDEWEAFKAAARPRSVP